MNIADLGSIENDENFWLYYLLTAFPLAYDEEEDLTLSDFIAGCFEPDGSFDEWIKSFTGYYDGVLDVSDGYVSDPKSAAVTAGGTEYVIQYHPGDTVYLADGRIIAGTGPHYDLHKLPFKRFAELAKELSDPKKALLLLPIVRAGEQDGEQACALIAEMLGTLPLEDLDTETAAKMIFTGLLPD